MVIQQVQLVVEFLFKQSIIVGVLPRLILLEEELPITKWMPVELPTKCSAVEEFM